MQVTIDIPEPLYLELQAEAGERHLSVQELAALRLGASLLAQREQYRVSLPLVRSETLGTVDLHQNLNDALFNDFPTT